MLKTNQKTMSILRSAQNAGNQFLFELDKYEKELSKKDLVNFELVEKINNQAIDNIALNKQDFVKVAMLLHDTYAYYVKLSKSYDKKSKADAVTAKYLSLAYVKWLKKEESKINSKALAGVTLHEGKLINVMEKIEVKKQKAFTNLLDIQDYEETIVFKLVNQYLEYVLQEKFLNDYLKDHKEIEDNVEEYFIGKQALMLVLELSNIRTFFRNNVNFAF